MAIKIGDLACTTDGRCGRVEEVYKDGVEIADGVDGMSVSRGYLAKEEPLSQRDIRVGLISSSIRLDLDDVNLILCHQFLKNAGNPIRKVAEAHQFLVCVVDNFMTVHRYHKYTSIWDASVRQMIERPNKTSFVDYLPVGLGITIKTW